jgi:hypothetical protein
MTPGRETDNELLRFAKLVKLMRSMQKRYFDGDRSRECLIQARDCEARVDKAVWWILSNRQGTLPLDSQRRQQDVKPGTPADVGLDPRD